MKKIFSLLVGMIFTFTMIGQVFAEYTPTIEDGILFQKMILLIERSISLKGEQTRQKYIDKLDKVQKNEKTSERVQLLSSYLIQTLTINGQILAGTYIPETITPDTTPAEAEPFVQVVPVTQSDKPVVELFVMSYCPYGLQAEKSFVPLIDKFKTYADIKIKFVHYTMHGFKEAQENTNQYCIQSEQNEKFTTYLQCFTKNGDSKKCLTEAAIDTTKLGTCYTETMKKLGGEKMFDVASGNFPEYNIDEVAAKKADVQGSPTFVVNGVQVNSERSEAAYAKMICSAFTEEKRPKICDEKFSETIYQPGFGVETQANEAATANCGN